MVEHLLSDGWERTDPVRHASEARLTRRDAYGEWTVAIGYTQLPPPIAQQVIIEVVSPRSHG